MVKLGFSKKNIIPDRASLPMAGYLCESRNSEGLHDRLYARVLAFTPEGGNPLVLVQLDLLFLDDICVNALRARLEKLGIPKSGLLICCIHTHSGYGGILNSSDGINRELIPLNGAFDRELADFLVKTCAAAAEEALAGGVETQVRMNRGKIRGLATNRHDPSMPCDDGLFIMEFLREDEKKILVYNLSCHPTVLAAGNRLLSADFAGAAAALLEAASGDPAMSKKQGVTGPFYDAALFINGSAGDMSTRFTRRESGFAECGRFGRMVYDAVAELTGGDYVPLESAGLEYYRVFLKRAAVPEQAEAEAKLTVAERKLEELRAASDSADPAFQSRVRKAESFVEGARISLLKARYREEAPGSGIPVEAGVLTLNGQKILCSPFELFSVLALPLKRRKNVECFGYVNALLGYLADAAAYDAMDYEALFSAFDRGQGERYIEQVETFL
jgi:hypothetical protein